MADPVLSGRGLTKRFGGLVAVRDVDIDIPRGEIFGLIGPNGAGKSTLFRLIAGIMTPSAGEVRFNGAPITKKSPSQICVAGVVATHQIVKPFRAMSVVEFARAPVGFGRRPLQQKNGKWSTCRQTASTAGTDVRPSLEKAGIRGYG